MFDGKADGEITLLARALLSLETEEEARALLSDLCTIKEIQALAQRIEVASLLKGQMKYNEIAAKTGASTATISRVNRSLNYGAGGYQLALRRLNEGKVRE